MEQPAEQRPNRQRYGIKERTAEEVDQELSKLMEELKARFGDRAPDELEGALIRRDITYDDYIETDTLLSLQQTLTVYHDELIFKVYHQQTELWFRLILHEIERAIKAMIAESPALAVATESVERINRYFTVLTTSFSVMLDGLSSEEFLAYRKAFGTSSGFQSSQFRAIEILAGLERETHSSASGDPSEADSFYWERAARHLTTNEPTQTLLNFREKHLRYLNELYAKRQPYSLRMAFDALVANQSSGRSSQESYRSILDEGGALRQLAVQLVGLDDAIVGWKQFHLRVAARHLARAPRGTGETNWAEYLARSIAEQRYFPELNAAKRSLEEIEPFEQPTLGDA